MQGLRQDGELFQDIQHVSLYPCRPEQYSVDIKTIKNMAKDLQKEFHPDRFSEDGNLALHDKMVKYSAYINEAKATLLNDMHRATYLM
jgi:DnaJ-domain-containing protein 1